jgi:predicted nucleic acid-binding Zn ribbon protein
MTRHAFPERIGPILDGMLSDRGYLSICRELQVVSRWPEIVGPEVAKAAECTRAENGVLYVRVASAAWRQELAYMKHLILDKVKKECASITDIVFG